MFRSGEFRSSLGSGVSKPTLFDVSFINVPDVVSDIENIKNLRMRCEETGLPGYTVSATTAKHYGPPREHAIGVQYDDIDLNFIVGESMMEKQIFDRWKDFILDPDTSDPRYYEEYVGEVLITQYDPKGVATYQIKLLECWPKAVGEIKQGWASTNDYQRLSVTMSYYSFEVTIESRGTLDGRRKQRSLLNRTVDQINRGL